MSGERLVAATGELLGHEFTAAELEAMLPELLSLRRQRDDLAGTYEKASGPIRSWLEAHPEETLRDGESGVSARLRPSRGATEVDAIALAGKRADLLCWLASKGALRLDVKTWQALQGKAVEPVEIKPFTFERGRAPSLIIDKE